ncbi:hypothetical protein K470DRAFT_259706 [Piedraia hortae CBS 480.64]|uniref:Uncharacterized protein n=1 Tax=Piedraia hortae CBS 480.64 TaxID=1314780 RepID=A0A6A7BVL4_9PEZI|nr:hypothetical protein K470DRAFT_259706 [Piedraia hortae CBS 480.64]
MRYITRIISNRRSALDFTRQLVFRRDLYAGTHLLTIIITIHQQVVIRWKSALSRPYCCLSYLEDPFLSQPVVCAFEERHRHADSRICLVADDIVPRKRALRPTTIKVALLENPCIMHRGPTYIHIKKCAFAFTHCCNIDVGFGCCLSCARHDRVANGFGKCNVRLANVIQ